MTTWTTSLYLSNPASVEEEKWAVIGEHCAEKIQVLQLLCRICNDKNIFLNCFIQLQTTFFFTVHMITFHNLVDSCVYFLFCWEVFCCIFSQHQANSAVLQLFHQYSEYSIRLWRNTTVFFCFLILIQIGIWMTIITCTVQVNTQVQVVLECLF